MNKNVKYISAPKRRALTVKAVLVLFGSRDKDRNQAVALREYLEMASRK